MDTDLQEQVAYYLTGAPSGTGLEMPSGHDVRPALLARYGDLDNLRYDFPVVLVDRPKEAHPVVSISGMMDALLDEIAEGVGPAEAIRLRHHGIRLEREMRRSLSAGEAVRLSEAWADAAARLLDSQDEVLADSLKRLRGACTTDGELAACDRDLPERLVRHVWHREAARKSGLARQKIDRLVLALSDILRSDDANSPDGTSAETLRGEFGPAFAAEFDFRAMSHVLEESRPKAALPKERRARVERLLATLQAQRFFAADRRAVRATVRADGAHPDAITRHDRPASNGRSVAAAGSAAAAPKPHGFVFRNCSEALDAFRRRLPELVELSKAMRMAELEVDGAYRADVHDRVFAAIGASDLGDDEIGAFPGYLVVVRAADMTADETAALMEGLAAALPLTVLVQADDLLGPPPRTDGLHVAPGAAVRLLARAAIAVGGVHVVQAAASHLYRVWGSLVRGVTHGGPTLFTVYSGAGADTSHLHPYLVAAAAVETRAFPVFTYEPGAGSDWASRMSLDANPQPENDWPCYELEVEDEALQRVTEEAPFTLVDFQACDARYVRRMARLPRAQWGDHLVPAAERIEAGDDGMPDSLPYVVVAGDDGAVHKLLVERALIRDARRCLEGWHSLQELGGIHNSFAVRLLERERRAWEEQAQLEAEARAAEAAATAVVATPAPSTEAVGAVAEDVAAPAAPARDPDVPLIETPRCSTCDECTKINNRMFKYNQNKQAYIADTSAGTYAEMVLAAERCQVAIIHPGKPWNPDEPGLDELVQRAAPFR